MYLEKWVKFKQLGWEILAVGIENLGIKGTILVIGFGKIMSPPPMMHDCTPIHSITDVESVLKICNYDL